MVNPEHKFHIADLVLFAIIIVVSLGIGVYYAIRGGQKTTNDYLFGGRKMNIMPVAISLLVSFESSIMMLGVPAEVYTFGIQWWIAVHGFFVGNLIGLGIVVPVFHPLNLTSVYEFLEMRFHSKVIRIVGTALGILSTLWYMGIVLFGPGIALEAVTGFPQWASIALIAIAAAIYTSIGGLKAVIWTDVFQALVMFCGCFAILIKGTIFAGGPTEVWNKAAERGRMNFFVFDTDPTIRHTFWSLFFGSVIRSMGWSFNQSTCQRISSLPTLRGAMKMMLITAPLHTLVLSLAVYEGIVAFSYYVTVRCDPLDTGEISNPNQIIPYLVMDIFKNLPGMPGLFLASLFSASLSTLSTGLSGLSAIFLKDIVKEIFKDLSEFRSTVVAKLSVLVSAILAIGVAILVSHVGGTMIQISGTLIATFGGPLAGLFLLGISCPWANSKGAFFGTLFSVFLCSWLGLGSSFSSSLPKAQRLQPAPNDHCRVDNSTLWSSPYNMTSLSIKSLHNITYSDYSMHYADDITTSNPAYTTNTPELHGVDKFYSISYLWFGPIGIASVIVVGSMASFITGSTKLHEVDERLIMPIVLKLGRKLPKPIGRILRFDPKFFFKGKKKELAEKELDIIIPDYSDKKQTVLKPEEMNLIKNQDQNSDNQT